MSDDQERTAGRGRLGWRDFLSSAFLIGAVAAILFTGWILKGDRPQTPPPAAPAVTLGSTIVPEPQPDEPPPAAAPPEPQAAAIAADEPPLDPRLDKLARRVADDLDRLSAARGSWAAQLVVACRPETVLRMLDAAGGARKLYVLPAEVRGDACFRVLWGSYANPKDAAAAADLPPSLRSKEKPGAVEIAKVLP